MMVKPRAIVVVPPQGIAPALERLRERADIVVVRTEEEYRAALPGAEIVFLNNFRSELLREVGPGDVRWIHTSSIGVDALLTREIIDSDIVVSNSRGVCERPIAEWILGVLLMFVKDLRRTVELQQRREWLHRETESLLGRRVLVVGPGPVGRETALLLRAAGMEVTVVGRSGRLDPELGEIRAIADLDNLLRAVDDVVLTLPLTEATRGLFNDERFAAMRRGARLVNVGRGAVVDERALLGALEAGHLGGAALDVFEEEPLPANHPLWTCSNVLVSPHASGDLVGWRDRVVSCFEANLHRWLAGQPLADVVDLREHGVSSSALTSRDEAAR
jgi:phosphoglycerate dehydrogenase-like enzyme